MAQEGAMTNLFKMCAAIVVAFLCVPIWAQEVISHRRTEVRVDASFGIGDARFRVEVRRGDRDRSHRDYDRRDDRRSWERSRYDDRRQYGRDYYPGPEVHVLRAPVRFGYAEDRREAVSVPQPEPRPRTIVAEAREQDAPRYKMKDGEDFLTNETSCLVTVGNIRTGEYFLLEPGAGTTTFWKVQDLVAETLDQSDRTYGSAQIVPRRDVSYEAYRIIVN
ncbi:MAG: hypothetical protein AAB608_02710 [Patescibacteria group bacterium]